MPPAVPAPDLTPHEFIDAEISVAGLDSPADERKLSDAFDGLNGIEKLTVAGGMVAVEYDPVRITKAELGDLIVRAGFRIAEMRSTPASTISDAFHPGQE